MVADVARRTLAAILIACSALVVASPAAASPSGRRQIEVFPGPHALAKALAEARPGDALELHTGTYRDDVTITTPTITIEPAGDGPVLIDGGCREIETIEVEADGVTIQGDIAVAGGLIYDLHYLDVLSGILEGVTLRSTCHTQFGVDLERTGPVTVSSNTAVGFGGAGIQVSDIADTGGGRILIASNEVSNSEEGILVSNSAGGRIELDGNRLGNSVLSDVHLSSSDGVLIQRNTARGDGTYGIELDGNSDGNTVKFNTAFGNTFDLSNSGQGNCFVHNRYRTSQGVIGC